MSELIVVMITTPAEDGPALARTLVEKRLAACVNLLAARSVYRWLDIVEDREEALLIVKTRRGVVEPMMTLLKELHPDENFELIALPIEDGSPAYLTWITQSVDLPEDEVPYFH